MGIDETVFRLAGYRYFLNVLAVTETLSAKSAAKGNTMKLGWTLTGHFAAPRKLRIV